MSALSLLSRPPLWREPRVAIELAALLRDPVFRGDGVNDGRGQPVFLIPGFLAGDDSLALMARWLRRCGYHTGRAGLRANVGCSGATVERIEDRLEELVRRLEDSTGRPLLGSPEGPAGRTSLRRRVEGLLGQREPIYESVADHVVGCEGRGPAEVADEIVSRIAPAASSSVRRVRVGLDPPYSVVVGRGILRRCHELLKFPKAAEQACKALHMALGGDAWGHDLTALLGALPQASRAPDELVDRAASLGTALFGLGHHVLGERAARGLDHRFDRAAHFEPRERVGRPFVQEVTVDVEQGLAARALCDDVAAPDLLEHGVWHGQKGTTFR